MAGKFWPGKCLKRFFNLPSNNLCFPSPHAIALASPLPPCYAILMADGNHATTSQPPPRGCFARALVLVLMLAAPGLAVAAYFMAQPQDLSDIHGYASDSRPQSRRNLALLLQNSLDRAYPVTFTEGEINRWLLSTLQTRQGGLLAASPHHRLQFHRAGSLRSAYPQ